MRARIRAKLESNLIVLVESKNKHEIFNKKYKRKLWKEEDDCFASTVAIN